MRAEGTAAEASDRSGDGFIGVLCRNLLEREGGNASTVTRVFDGDATDVAFSINIQESVLFEIASLGYFDRPKLNVKRIGVLEILNLHGLKDLSKNALCTVSPSDRSITRKYFPSISGICTHRRIRPSV